MPRKLTLKPESLLVESFESGEAADLQGTVEAYDLAKVPCVISGSIRFSCPPTSECLDGPPPAV
jgi:hypothetical protein